MKNIIYIIISIFIFITACSHFEESRVRIINKNDKNAINVYIGSRKYSKINANSKTKYEFIKAGKYNVKGSYENAADSFNSDIEIEWGPLYSLTIDNNKVELIKEQEVDPEQY